jgi:hypothetical protein
MNDPFERKVRAAAVAGWWALLIAVAFLTLQWLVYLHIAHHGPSACMLLLWGPGVDWAFVQNVWFWMTAIFKLCVWLLALIVVWLTLWARQLRKGGS